MTAGTLALMGVLLRLVHWPWWLCRYVWYTGLDGCAVTSGTLALMGVPLRLVHWPWWVSRYVWYRRAYADRHPLSPLPSVPNVTILLHDGAKNWSILADVRQQRYCPQVRDLLSTKWLGWTE